MYNATQGEMHEEFFAALNALMAALTDRGIVDDTLVLVASEMGRTPRHNADGGKDHWPWTSAMLVGSNVAGGRAYGQTDDWLVPGLVDLDSGNPLEGGTDVHAANVLRAAAELVGVSAQEAGDWYEREAYRALLA